MNERCTQHAVTACWELKNDANMIRNERTLHTVRGYRVLGAQKRFKYGKNWTNSAHSTRLPRSWEPKNDANIVRNERTLHAARGYRVVGAQKMVQFFFKEWTNSAHSTGLPRSWEPKNDANNGKKWLNSAHSTRLPRSWERKNGANMAGNGRTLHTAPGYRVLGA